VPVQVIPFRSNSAVRLTFPPRAYLDTNFVVFVRDAASPKYRVASECFAELIRQNVALHVSALMFDELWCLYLKKLHERATGVDLTANVYKRDPRIWQSYWPQIDQLTNTIRGWQGIVELPSPPDLVQRAQALISLNPLAPRDAFHLALTLHHAIQCFVTADSDFDNIQLPAGSPNLVVLKII